MRMIDGVVRLIIHASHVHRQCRASLRLSQSTRARLKRRAIRTVLFLRDWCGLWAWYVALYVIVRNVCILTGFVVT